MIIPVVITAYADRSFTFITRPPAAALVMAAKVEKVRRTQPCSCGQHDAAG